MKEGWVLVYSAMKLYQAKIAEDVLKQNGIISHIPLKPDSIIPPIGEAELYAPEGQAEKALEVLIANNIIERKA